MPNYSAPSAIRQTPGNGYLFGVPLRDLGWFVSLLISVGTAMASFFAGTFIGIVTIMIANAGHAKMDYSWAYLRFGLPFGILMGVVTLAYLGTMWVKRQARRG